MPNKIKTYLPLRLEPAQVAGAGAALAIVALLGWIFSQGNLKTLNVAGVALANPDTQIPKVRVDNIGVHGIIGNGAHTHGPMTAAQEAADQEQHVKVEADIFFKPGGLYTAADIAKNGPLSPSQKFKDLMSRHDLKTVKGDRICPITETKANELFYWWIGGKRYTFCCPPCVEEFVLRAKKGEKIGDPDDYVKR